MIMTMVSALSLLRTMDQFSQRALPKVHAGPQGKEIEAVNELRNRVGHLMYSDYAREDSSLLRWLRAKKLDIDAAEKMIIKHLEWRKRIGMDQLRIGKPSERMLQQFWYNMTGYDKRGNPVMLMNFGRWDIRTYLDNGGDLLNFDKHQGQMWEKALVAVEKVEQKQTQSQRKPILKEDSPVQYVMICDLEGFQYRQMASYKSLQAILSMVYNFENNYPEVIYYCYIINADWIFEMLLRIIRPFMQGSIEKLKVFGNERIKWEKAVRKIVDPATLPYRFGGLKEKKI